MKILITGGSGFVGSNLAVYLSQKGHQVTCLDNLSRRGSEILLSRILELGCDFVHGDIRNPEDFGKLKGSFDTLIECSAEPSVLVGTEGDDARYMLNVNLAGSLNCFEYARKTGAGVIFISTSRVYPYTRLNELQFVERDTRFELKENSQGVSINGVSTKFDLKGARSLYGATKLASEVILEEYAHSYNMPAIINRCGVIAGPWQLGKVDQGVFTFWLTAHYFKKNLKYIGFGGKGKQVRDLLHVLDLCELVEKQLAALPKYRGEVFNSGGSRPVSLSLLETTALCEEITGNKVSVMQSPENRPADVIWYVTDNGQTEPEFGWKPKRTPKEILQDTFNWIKENESRFSKLFNS
ncbi:MAG: NAD-dependent epimerase/dehydratase family protein [Chloroherpetonaceae bacterium]|nr:NAD-dependent epimerase/dehydratase family protein [Chloroherpetonaceae bacterium]